MGSSTPRLRIVQVSPAWYAIQQQTWEGWLWWRKQVWVNYAAKIYRGCDPCTGGEVRYDSPIHFASIEAAEAWLQEQQVLQQYPKVVKELSV